MRRLSRTITVLGVVVAVAASATGQAATTNGVSGSPERFCYVDPETGYTFYLEFRLVLQTRATPSGVQIFVAQGAFNALVYDTEGHLLDALRSTSGMIEISRHSTTQIFYEQFRFVDRVIEFSTLCTARENFQFANGEWHVETQEIVCRTNTGAGGPGI